MALLDFNPETTAGYGMDVPAAQGRAEHPIEHHRRRHRELQEQHNALTSKLCGALEKECARLERECAEMAGYLDTISASQPTTNRAY